MAWVNVIDLFWPVGSVFTTYGTYNPAEVFGGTWAKLNSTEPYTWRRTA